MRLQCELRGHLAIEGDAAFESTNGCQKAVEVTSATPNPATVKGEAYAWNEGKVQFV